jgi:hypothetical protein
MGLPKCLEVQEVFGPSSQVLPRCNTQSNCTVIVIPTARRGQQSKQEKRNGEEGIVTLLHLETHSFRPKKHQSFVCSRRPSDTQKTKVVNMDLHGRHLAVFADYRKRPRFEKDCASYGRRTNKTWRCV